MMVDLGLRGEVNTCSNKIVFHPERVLGYICMVLRTRSSCAMKQSLTADHMFYYTWFGAVWGTVLLRAAGTMGEGLKEACGCWSSVGTSGAFLLKTVDMDTKRG